MKKVIKGVLFPILISLAFAAAYFYIFIPAINLRSGAFWFFIFMCAAVFLIAYIFFVKPDWYYQTKSVLDGWFKSSLSEKSGKSKRHGAVKVEGETIPKAIKISFISLVSVIALLLILTLFTSSKIFRAADYQAMLKVEETDFAEDIAEIPISQIPIVDRETAEKLGKRKIGEVVELVSQFDVSDLYSQINYQNKPYRVSPLQYADILKWLSNREDGIPYYVSIDMATQDTQLVKLPEGMKYSPSEYFGRDVNRHIRMKYPTRMFENLSFEINEEGHPFWVMSYYDYTFGLFGGKDIEGIILVDAVSGETADYALEDVPKWIDLAYSPELAVEQANNWGTLKNGFLNSIFVQRDVVVTTEGYNYIANDDDVWLYTGITSVSADESNIGFILINMRTKEAKRYMINGAEEYSAMDSAEGKIQEKGYTATFPILINVENIPSYFLSLKDNGSLVKAYAFVSVSDYQIVGVADTIAGAKSEYLRMLGINKPQIEIGATQSFTETVDGIATAVKDGNSLYYIKIGENIYTADISVSDILPFLKAGDKIKFEANSEKVIAKLEIINGTGN